MTDNARIAIIEDNDDLREELVFFLQSRGHSVWGQSSAESFWKQLHRTPADIVLVDIGLPGEDGFSVIEYLRTVGSYGLIVISARGSRDDQLRGLGLGADHYLIKPINFADLAQTVQALWSRLQKQSSPDATGHPPASAANWKLEHNSLQAPDGRTLHLTTQEHRLIEALYRHRNEVCSKEMLHNLLFGYEPEPDIHRIDVILNRLRSKARQQHFPLPLRTIFAKGVVLVSHDP